MEKLYWSIDFDEIICENQIEYFIEGWAAACDGEDISIGLLADGREEIPCTIQIKARPDVQQTIDQVTKRTDLGFRIQVEQIEEIWQKHKKLELYLSSGETKECAWKKETGQIRQMYCDVTLDYKIDIVEQIDGLMTIQGWVLDRFQDETLKLADEEGKPVPHKMMRIIRTDVNKAHNLEEENRQSGFRVQIVRKEVKCRQIRLQLSNQLTTREYIVDLKKFDYEHSKRGRLAVILSARHRDENRAYIKEHGIKKFIYKVRRELEPEYADYNTWLKEHRADKRQLREQRRHKFSYEPLISVVIPLYNTPPDFLKEMLDSLLTQTYGKLELCLADGSSNDTVKNFIQQKYGQESRIVYQQLTKNLGISMNTNAAVKLAAGEFIMLADHDDIVAPDAVYELVKALNENPRLDILYTDEDKVTMDGKKYYGANFKSDFNIDLLRSVNYICHIFMVRRTIVEKAGDFRKEFDGAQDYDFILRCCEQTSHIGHIPKALYHWRAHPDSTAGNPQSKQYAVDAGKHVLEEHYARLGIDAVVENTGIFGIYRTIFKVQGNPMVSIIILNKDHINDLDICITSIAEKSTYANFEILVIENNSQKPETFAYYEEIQKKYQQIRVITWNGEFNFASINNYGASFAKGEYLLMLNNDIEVITPSWMEEMLGYCQRPDVGIVGAKLYYPDDSIQHAGVVIGMGGIAGHVLCKADGKEYGYNARLVTVQDISAVTAACLMISKADFEAVDGFDEVFTVAFNDIDFCLKVRAMDKLVVFNPYAELYHYESKSRGAEDTPKKLERFRKEVRRFQKNWKEILEQGDPYYNPNLTLADGDCSLRGSAEKLIFENEETKGR